MDNDPNELHAFIKRVYRSAIACDDSFKDAFDEFKAMTTEQKLEFLFISASTSMRGFDAIDPRHRANGITMGDSMVADQRLDGLISSLEDARETEDEKAPAFQKTMDEIYSSSENQFRATVLLALSSLISTQLEIEAEEREQETVQ